MLIDTIGLVHPLKTELDEESFQHIIYGLNRVLLILREGGGFNRETIIAGGKVLFRLARIIQAYVHKKNKEDIPAEEFTKRALEVISSAHTTFVGSLIPKLL